MVAALAGMTALAIPMGVGRFAFTPILPMMQADAGLSVAAGGWLASANYLGYLAGSVAAIRMRLAPEKAIPSGLLGIRLATLGMGFASGIALWIALRALAAVGWGRGAPHPLLRRLGLRVHYPRHLPSYVGARGGPGPGCLRLGVADLRHGVRRGHLRRGRVLEVRRQPAPVGLEPRDDGGRSHSARHLAWDSRRHVRGIPRGEHLHGGHHDGHAGGTERSRCRREGPHGRHDLGLCPRTDPWARPREFPREPERRLPLGARGGVRAPSHERLRPRPPAACA